jgi:N-acetylglucosaminyl-diphospho-decaprenol L-rhamnosyltransferase
MADLLPTSRKRTNVEIRARRTPLERSGPERGLAAIRQAAATPRPTTVAPLISVIIVNYRRWADTAALVDQLLSEDALFRDQIEIIIVDNASPDHPAADRLRNRTGVQLHRHAVNRGFAAGVNHGFTHSRGEWLLILNPDLVLCQGFSDLLCLAARAYRAEDCSGAPIGVVGFQLRNRDGTHQHSAGFFPSLGKMLAGLLRPRRRRKYVLLETNDRQTVPWVTGCCTLVRRKCFEELGGFDEEFFLYYEDVDLCRRAAERGWAVWYEPAVEAVHLDPLQNRKPVPTPMWAITRHASLTYFRKHHAGWQHRGLSRIVCMEAWLRERLARLRGRNDAAAICRDVRAICRELVHNRSLAARRRLEHVLRLAKM